MGLNWQRKPTMDVVVAVVVAAAAAAAAVEDKFADDAASVDEKPADVAHAASVVADAAAPQHVEDMGNRYNRKNFPPGTAAASATAAATAAAAAAAAGGGGWLVKTTAAAHSESIDRERQLRQQRPMTDDCSRDGNIRQLRGCAGGSRSF